MYTNSNFGFKNSQNAQRSYFLSASIDRDNINDRDMLLKLGLSRSNRDDWQAYLLGIFKGRGPLNLNK